VFFAAAEEAILLDRDLQHQTSVQLVIAAQVTAERVRIVAFVAMILTPCRWSLPVAFLLSVCGLVPASVLFPTMNARCDRA
jgi:hypothetical protein